MKCNACNLSLRREEQLVCVDCMGTYHYMCLNMTAAYYSMHLKDLSTTWTCPSCNKVSVRRKGDETPVRKQHEISSMERSYDINNMSCDYGDADISTLASNTLIDQIGAMLDSKLDLKLDTKLSAMQAKLTHDFRNHLNVALDRIKKEFTETTDCLQSQIIELRNDLSAHQQIIQSLQSKHPTTQSNQEISDLRHTIDILQADINDRKQLDLANELEISGIPECDSESLVHTVLNIASKLGISLDERDISHAQRLGPRRPTEGVDGVTLSSAGRPSRPRLIAVKLERRSTRDELIRMARFKRNLVSSDIVSSQHNPLRVFINERLTKLNRMLFAKVREFSHTHKWRFVWSKGGRIYARQHESSPIRLFRSDCDVSRIFINNNVSTVSNT